MLHYSSVMTRRRVEQRREGWKFLLSNKEGSFIPVNDQLTPWGDFKPHTALENTLYKTKIAILLTMRK